MEIIKHGCTAKKIVCKSCGCEFIATKKDWECDGFIETYGKLICKYKIKCPECNYELNMKER